MKFIGPPGFWWLWLETWSCRLLSHTHRNVCRSFSELLPIFRGFLLNSRSFHQSALSWKFHTASWSAQAGQLSFLAQSIAGCIWLWAELNSCSWIIITFGRIFYMRWFTISNVCAKQSAPLGWVAIKAGLWTVPWWTVDWTENHSKWIAVYS